jgi:SAM-dependent methyltransferase/CRP-like cAMP-binding protein
MFVHVQHVQHPADREQVYRFRYRVLVEALRQAPAWADHKQRMVKDDLDDQARLLVAVDEQNGAVVGTLRSCFGRDQPLDARLVSRMGLGPMVRALGMERISYTSGLVVDPAFGGETIASTLATQLYSVALAKRIQVDTLACDPSLASTCFQLGYRPYGEPIQRSGPGEPRLPLALLLRHGSYLTKVRSPFAKVTYHPPAAGEKTAVRVAEQYPAFSDQEVVPQKLDSFWAALAHVNTPAPPPSLFAGIDRADLEPELAGLPKVWFGTDQKLDELTENPDGMGLLLSGRLGLTVGDGPRPFFVSILRPGEVFGQMGGLAATGTTPTIVALEDCELLLLPQDLPDRVHKRDPALAQIIRRNLANILVYRLELMNRRVAGFMAGSPERITPEAAPLVEETPPPQAEPEPVAEATTNAAPEPSAAPEPVVEAAPVPAPDEEVPPEILDPVPPLSRVLPWDAESRWLQRVGLRDVSTILVIGDGSGEGVLRLARSLPRTRVVGVLSPELIPLVTERLDEAGVSERCTLVPTVAGRIPLGEHSVDHAWLRFAFHDAADPEHSLAELRRVLRPGGVVAAQDLDDGGLMVQPEPAGLASFLARVEALPREGGSRRVGRSLVHLLSTAGFERSHGLVLPLTPGALSVGELASSTFGPMAEQLYARGVWTRADTQVMQELRELGEREDAWICVPVVCAAARAPEG